MKSTAPILFLGATLLSAPGSTASVVSNSGATAVVSPPSSVLVNAFQSSTEIRLFPERVNLSLATAMSVNITAPGTYSSHPTTLQTIAAGTSVDSYLLHFDPVSGTPTRSGSVTFDRKILGVIVRDAQLNASDGTLGAVGTTYPTGLAGRELDLDIDAADSVTVSCDRRTITIQTIASVLDQVRVVTEAQSTTFTPVAGIVNATGAVVVVASPPSVEVGDFESNAEIRVFNERQQDSLSAAVDVNVSAPGTYSSTASLTSATIPAGTVVNSYLIHGDKLGSTGSQTLCGSITFDSDIVGVIGTDADLDASDATLAAPGTAYPTATGLRAFELDTEPDTLILTSDRRTLIVQFRVSSVIDSLRVLTASNEPPVAVCQNVEAFADFDCQAPVTPEQVDGGSYDPQGAPVSLSLSPAGPYAVGLTPVTLTVQDELGAADSCSATITVLDSTAPSVLLNGTDPMTVECRQAFLDPGAVADDACGCPPAVSVSGSVDVNAPGTYALTYSATDTSGNTAAITRTVNVVDTISPAVSRSLDRIELWPPDHELVNVGLSASALEACDSQPTFMVSVFADEEDEEDTGDGSHSPDAAGVGLGTLRLRSERHGDRDGRVYLVVVRATDGSTNSSVSCGTVVVPKDQSAAGMSAVLSQATAAESFCVANDGAPPPGYFVVGDGPIIGPNQ